MIKLKKGKFISGAKIFSAGEILPDNPNVQKLVYQGFAEVIADLPKKSAKARKLEPETAEIAQENVKINP